MTFFSALLFVGVTRPRLSHWGNFSPGLVVAFRCCPRFFLFTPRSLVRVYSFAPCLIGRSFLGELLLLRGFSSKQKKKKLLRFKYRLLR